MRTLPVFDKITWMNAVVGIILLSWQSITGSIPMGWQIFYFILMIGSAGIPHGALDHHIARANAAHAKKSFTIPRFLLRYVAVIIFYSYCWIKLPGISLIIFLLISAWHFGETDLHAVKNTWLWKLSRFLWGSLVLLVLLLTHAEETTLLVLRITNQSSNAISILEFFTHSGFTIGVSILLLCILFIVMAHKQNNGDFKISHIANLLIIIILTAYLPLLPAFALYFGGWHAIRSFEIIFTFLNKQNHEAATSPTAMWKNAIPMTFLAAVGFVFMAFIWKGTGLQIDPLPFIFIFLSVITLPHLDVMDKLINSKESH
jgi:Brp/Blh family beta-carotene 15,15'-monooxygenase